MSGFHIRCREPGISAAFEVKATWGDDVTTEQLKQLLAETHAAAMERTLDAINARRGAR